MPITNDQPIEITLTGDRVVNVFITDKHGEIYNVNMEFVAHDFDQDDVQLSIHKVPKDYKERLAKGLCATMAPNRMLHNEKRIAEQDPNHYLIPSVWFEFHAIETLNGSFPAVRS